MMHKLFRKFAKKTISGTSKIIAAILPCNNADFIADEVLAKAKIKQLKYKVQGYNNKITDANVFGEKLLRYDVISFDIFDTLLLRNVSSPRVVFDIIGERINFQNFRDVRVKVERDLRQRSNNEVAISQIYEELEKKYGIDSERVKQFEVKLEKKLAVPNPYMARVFEYISRHRTQQKVIITSDMYLSYETIKSMLDDCGYSDYDKLFLSSNESYQKLNCSLFKHIKGLYPGKSIIHVGDNESVDYKNAKSCGLHAIIYPNIHKRIDFNYLMGDQNLSAAFYLGLSDREMFTSDSNYLYKTGYCFFGVVVYGFVRWIKEMKSKYSAANILFASRDMRVVHDVYRALYGDDESVSYIAVSRFALLRADFSNSINRFIDWIDTVRRSTNNNKSLNEIFEDIGLSELSRVFESKLDCDKKIDDNFMKKVEAILFESKPKILDLLNEEHINAQKYLISKVNDGNNLFVDLSGKCTSPIIIQNILNEEGLSSKIISLLMYSDTSMPFINTKYIEESLDYYLFSDRKNKTAQTMLKISGKDTVGILESIFSEMKGSLISYRNYPAFKYSNFDAEKNGLDEIHRGIFDFCMDFQKVTMSKARVDETTAIDALFSGIYYIKNHLEAFQSDLNYSSNNKV